jgi:hypothetical protein
VPGGDRWDPREPRPDPLCELLDCLRKTGAMNEQFTRRLKDLGIDAEALLRCLARKCVPPEFWQNS